MIYKGIESEITEKKETTEKSRVGVPISLTGDLFSGKSTVGDMLQERLGYKVYSLGVLFRQQASLQGMSVLEYNKSLEGTKEDYFFDMMLIDLVGRQEIIIDARLGWLFLPESFKVYFKCSKECKLQRLEQMKIEGVQRDAEYLQDSTEFLADLENRKESETSRYNALYSIDYECEDNYDLIVDTSNKTLEEVTEEVLRGYREYCKGDGTFKIQKCVLMPNTESEQGEESKVMRVSRQGKRYCLLGDNKQLEKYIDEKRILRVSLAKVSDIESSERGMDKEVVIDKWEQDKGIKFLVRDWERIRRR